jgi:hypothetical protein
VALQRPFTERFIASTLQSAWVDYHVPAGYRAVVRNVAATSFVASAGLLQVVAGPTVLAAHDFPAASAFFSFETRAVAYAGEVIRSFMNTGNGAVTICGYLFADNTVRGTQLPATDQGPWPPPTWEVAP